MSDEQLQRAWRATRGPRGRIAEAHLDAYRDVVRPPPDRAALDALDALLRRAGDGPWLPVLVRLWLDVTIGGPIQVEIMDLPHFEVRLDMSTVPTVSFSTRWLEGLVVRGLPRAGSAEIVGLEP